MARALVCGDLDSNDGYTNPACVILNNFFIFNISFSLLNRMSKCHAGNYRFLLGICKCYDFSKCPLKASVLKTWLPACGTI